LKLVDYVSVPVYYLEFMVSVKKPGQTIF